MEAELEKHLSQFGSERQQLRDKLVTDERRQRELEEALRKARVDVEHFKKQLSEAHRVAMSQVAPPPPYPTSTASTSVSPTPRAAGPAGPGQVAGNPAVVSGVSQQPAQQSHTMKFHSNAYTANSTPGDFLGKNMVHHF